MGDTHVLIVADQLHPGGAGRRAADRALFDAAILRILHSILAPNWPAPGSVICALPLWWWGIGRVRPLDLENTSRQLARRHRAGIVAGALTLELYRSADRQPCSIA